MGYPRAELEEMVERWLAVNRDCEAKGDWSDLAGMYTEEATYGWNVGATDEFMAVGRSEILHLALGLEIDWRKGRLESQQVSDSTLAWINFRYYWN